MKICYFFNIHRLLWPFFFSLFSFLVSLIHTEAVVLCSLHAELRLPDIRWALYCKQCYRATEICSPHMSCVLLGSVF